MRRRGSTLLTASAVLAVLLLLAGCGATQMSRTSPAPGPGDPVRFLGAMPVPLALEAPADLPVIDLKPGLSTWRAEIDAEDAIRVMTPQSIGPATGVSRPAPADFHAYLVGLEADGARITDDRATTADGVRGHLFTITSERTIDTGLGCWSEAPGSCFGLTPQLTLRMATFTVRGRPVLLWARTVSAHPSVAMAADLERMLRTVRFRR